MSRVCAAAGLTVRSWPGQTVAAVFSADSVTTHLVSEIGAAVLELARSAPVSALEALAVLEAPGQPLDSAGSAISDDLLLMDETITGLVAAGLLRRVE